MPSIAVLPFECLEEDRGQRLADGLTADIISDLARHRDIFVIARHSILKYRSRKKSVADVGRELGVQYVLEGTLQIGTGRVRSAIQLIDVSTDTNVWSDKFERPISEIFELQDELAAAVVNQLVGTAGALTRAARRKAQYERPASLDAYDLYVLGLNVDDLFTPQGTRESLKFFKQSVELDPNFARAWNRLASMHLIDAVSGYTSDLDSTLRELAAAAKKAVALDPNEPMIQAIFAVACFVEGDIDKGRAACDRALKLGPNDADTLATVAYTRPTKLPTAAEDVELARLAMCLNPNYPHWYLLALGYSCFHARQYRDSVDAFSRTRTDIADHHLYLALCYAELGDEKRSEQHKAELLRLVPAFSAKMMVEADAMTNPDAAEHFLRAAQKANLPE